MADENQNGNGGAVPIEDSPGERADEFSQWLGVPASGYGTAVESALEHLHSASADSSNHGWVSIGPRNVGGAIRAIAQHLSQRNLFFAGSSQGGLWKSEDNGYSWRPVGAPTLTVPVGAIAIAPSNPQVMYVGTGEPASGPGGTGIYKSEDGGNSFSKIAGNASSGDDGGANHYARLVVDPFESHRMWAATTNGLWRFDPSGFLGLGGGFTRESIPGAVGNVTDVALAPDPRDPDKYVLLAGVRGRGIFRAIFSRSSGTGPWTAVTSGGPAGSIALPPPPAPAPAQPQFGRIRLAFSGTKAGVTATPFAYAIMEDRGVMPGRVAVTPGKDRLGYPTFVYRSQDFGQTWFADAGSTAIEPPTRDKSGQAFYSLQIAVDPNDPEHVLAGYVNLQRSTDRGKTFTEILDWGLYDDGDRAQHGDQHAIVFDLRDSRQVWVGNDGGISFTADYMTLATPPVPGTHHVPTARWRKRSYGIGAAQFTAIATHPRFPFVCGGGMQDNGTFISYGGPTWYRLDGGDGGQMAFHPSDPRQYFTTSQETVDSVQLSVAGAIVTATIGAGGTGYVLNDTGRINNGNFDATYQVTGVDGSGAVTSFTVTAAGTRCRVVNNVATADAGAQPGVGVGFTVNITAVQAVAPFPLYSATLPDVDPPGNILESRHSGIAFPAANASVFVGIVEADPAPANPGRLLIGRKLAGFYTVDSGATLASFTPALAAANEVTAMAFAPGGNDVWVGTQTGALYTSAGVALAAPPASTGLTARALPTAGRVNAIVVHPQNVNVVAVAITAGGGSGQVYLSHDGGQHWALVNGSGSSSLPPGPIITVVFDPGNTQVIFAGTMAGVYVARNLPARPAGAANLGGNFDAEWKTYSSGLPPVQVNDLEVTPIKNTLRCATFGRGAFEAELPPTTPANFRIPEVRLMIRSNPIDDSFVRDRPGGNAIYPNLFFDDPRLPAPPAPAADFDYTHALDIRVDAPGFVRSEAFAFGEEIDGVEFDETLLSDKPLAGDINHVYVQVHNRGFGATADVKVSLYYAKADHVPAPAGPLTAPNIDNRINYPAEPSADSPWKLAAPPQTLGALAPGEPRVVRFEWVAPLELTDGVALMAVCSDNKDQLAAIPAGDSVAFVKAERRAALRITAVNRDTAYIRDGVDDDARPGGVAWGGHSPDLIVMQAAVANPDDPAGPFKDLDDQRTSDVVKAGANFIYVRVFNRTRLAANAKVKVYALPIFDLARTAGWTQLPAGPPLEVAVNAIAPQGWKFATFNWNGVTDPDPANASAYKGFVLLAMASVVDAAGAVLDPYPDLQDVKDLESFWRFFTSGPLANNAAVRAIRFQP